MTSLILRQTFALLLALGLSFSAFAGTHSQASEETSIRALIERYFAGYAKEDLEAITQMWTDKSPDLAQAKARLQEIFSLNDRIEVSNLQFRRLTIEGERASAIVTLEITAIEAKTNRRKLGMGKSIRNMDFVKESGEWKIWSDATAEGALAARLVEAKSDEERDRLLAEDKELLTPALVASLNSIAAPRGIVRDTDQSLNASLVMQYVSEKMGDKALLAAAFNNIASIMQRRGKTDEAIDFHERSAKLREEAGLKHTLYIPLVNLGVLYGNLGNYSRAMEVLQRALTIAEEIGNKSHAAFEMHKIAQVHINQSNFDLALEYAKRSLALYEQLGEKRDLSLLSRIYTRTGNFDEAIKIEKSLLDREEQRGHGAGVAVSQKSLGDIYSLHGDYRMALEYHEKALSRINELDDGSKLTLFFEIGVDYFHIGDYDKTIHYSSRAVSIARQFGYLPVLSDSLTWVGKAYYALGRTDDARRAFDEAITTLETLRTQVAGGEQERQQFFEERVSPYYAMVDLLVAENKHQGAFTYSELAKGRVLLDVIRNRRTTIGKSMNAAEREREKRLNEAVAALNTQIQNENARPQPNQTRLGELKANLEQARLDYRDFQARLYAAHPELRIKRGETQTLTLEQAGALLTDSKTALLEYSVAGDKTFLFVITANAVTRNGLQQPSLKLYDLKIKRHDLVARVRKLNQRIANNDIEFDTQAKDLYNLLLAPARDQLQGKTRLVIVPDDILWETPFQALRSENGRFLIQDAAISYAPSLTVLREIGKSLKPKSATTLLAMGNPKLAGQTVARSKNVLMSGSFEPLPDAERMVRELAQIYGAKASKVYVGAEAREEVLKAEAASYRILQLATHGVLNNASPMYSHVVLAQGDETKEDGLLEAWEIMEMDLQADLVVLSACETARGRIGAGEGVIGLSWALFVAGCPTTVVSQWKVESSSTTELMLAFHRHLQAGATKSEAMRQAALKLMADKRYDHPFYWAGFMVVGDGN